MANTIISLCMQIVEIWALFYVAGKNPHPKYTSLSVGEC